MGEKFSWISPLPTTRSSHITGTFLGLITRALGPVYFMRVWHILHLSIVGKGGGILAADKLHSSGKKKIQNGLHFLQEVCKEP